MSYLPTVKDKLNLRILNKSLYNRLLKFSPSPPRVSLERSTIHYGHNYYYYPVVDIIVDEVGPSTTSLRVDVSDYCFPV